MDVDIVLEKKKLRKVPPQPKYRVDFFFFDIG